MLFSKQEIHHNLMCAIFASIIAILAFLFFPYLFLFFTNVCHSVILGKGVLVTIYIALVLMVGYSWAKYLWRRMG